MLYFNNLHNSVIGSEESNYQDVKIFYCVQNDKKHMGLIITSITCGLINRNKV